MSLTFSPPSSPLLIPASPPPFARSQHLTDTAPATPINYKERRVRTVSSKASWSLIIFGLVLLATFRLTRRKETLLRHIILKPPVCISHQRAITGKDIRISSTLFLLGIISSSTYQLKYHYNNPQLLLYFRLTQ